MFNMGKLVGVAVVVGMLSGCTAGVAEVAGESAPAEVVESAEPTETPSAAPVAIETTAPADPTANFNGFGSQREWYLRTLEGALSAAPSDEDLIGAGALACQQLTDGTPRADVRVVEGGTEQDNVNIVGAAVQVYCPEFT